MKIKYSIFILLKEYKIKVNIMVNVLEAFKGGDRLSVNTVAKRLGICRRYAMKLCCASETRDELRRVSPTEVGWMAHESRSRIFIHA